MRVKRLPDAGKSMRPPSPSTPLLPPLPTSVIKDCSLEDYSEPLRRLISRQDDTAKTSDRDDILAMMEATIQARNDFEIINNLLQIPVDTEAMVGAMRSLRNDRQTSIEGASLTSGLTHTPNESIIDVAESTPDPPDSLKSQFTIASLNALRRFSGKDDVTPSWTITPYELAGYGDRPEHKTKFRVGLGAASFIYRGGWRNHQVAIKEIRLTKEGIQAPLKHESEAWQFFNREVSFRILG